MLSEAFPLWFKRETNLKLHWRSILYIPYPLQILLCLYTRPLRPATELRYLGEGMNK